MSQIGFSAFRFAVKQHRPRWERFVDQSEAATLRALLIENSEPV